MPGMFDVATWPRSARCSSSVRWSLLSLAVMRKFYIPINATRDPWCVILGTPFEIVNLRTDVVLATGNNRHWFCTARRPWRIPLGFSPRFPPPFLPNFNQFDARDRRWYRQCDVLQQYLTLGIFCQVFANKNSMQNTCCRWPAWRAWIRRTLCLTADAHRQHGFTDRICYRFQISV